jgi:hypothetical protein
MRTILFGSAVIAVLASTSLAAQTTATATTKPDTLHWGPAPAVFPAGAQMAVVSGDPSKSGVFRVQLKMPDGYRIPPHFHPTDENVDVKHGTLMVGMGDVFDASKAKPMNVGEHGTIPARGHHFASARGDVLVEITSAGPFAMTYVNPADTPPAARP